MFLKNMTIILIRDIIDNGYIQKLLSKSMASGGIKLWGYKKD